MRTALNERVLEFIELPLYSFKERASLANIEIHTPYLRMKSIYPNYLVSIQIQRMTK